MRNLFLLLALIVAGVQSAWAQTSYTGEDTHGGIKYYTYATPKQSIWGNSIYISHTASVAGITGTGDVIIPSYWNEFVEGTFTIDYVVSVTDVGWWQDQQQAEDVYCTSIMTSLTFSGAISIHGKFTLQNLYGSLTFNENSTIKSDATLNIPNATSIDNVKKLNVEGSIQAPSITSLNINGSVSGLINANSATELSIASGSQVTGTVNVQNATRVIIDANSFYGTVSSGKLSSITLGKTDFGASGKLLCPLTDIYIPSKTALPTFYGTYYDHFSTPYGNITVHVYDMSTNEIAAMKNSPVWNGFTIVNHKTNVSYTLVNNSMATVSFLGKDGGYDAPTNESQYAQVISGSKTGTVKAERDYSVEIRDIDFDTKTVTLKRNGQSVALTSSVNQGLPVRYYDDLDLQQDVRYEVSVSDLTCDIDFAQQVYTGRIMYQKTLNGSNSTGVISSQTARITCTRGSRLKLTIPYDPTSYTPNKLYLNGSEVTMTKANGEATATITVPTAASADVLLTWLAPEPIVVVVPDPEEPEQTVTKPAHHQPKITIMRSGEGNILLKGLCNLYDEQQSIDAYEQEFGYEAQNGWVVNAVANCTGDVTTVTVPDVDYLGRGGYLDMIDWGFSVDITPVAGQTVKSLMMGWIVEDDEGRQYIEWESFSTTGAYLNDDDGDGTFTFSFAGDEMNWWIGDYIVNIVMGPEETAVETGKTLNFVRQGGRGHAWIYWHDTDYDYYFDEDGSSTKVIPNEQLTDLQMTVQLNEGESMHVYKNGVDITGQFQQRESSDEFWVELDKESATYTLLIDDAPDANPTWSIHNATEADVIVEQTLKDGTTETATYVGNLNDLVIDDTQVSKVTLKVYAEDQNESKPVRVLMNGQDVSYQFSTMPNDGDGFRLCYEVPVSELTNCSWDISYNTDHQQTIVVKGGSRETLVDFGREILYNGPVFSIFRNDGPATIYLPPFDSEYNSYIDMMVYANAGEKVTILRNGVDVTALFEEKAASGYKYYDLDINDADFEGDNTVSQFGFDIRDAAVWEITIEEPLKMLNAYANNDVIVSIAKLVDGEQPTFAGRENAIHRWINVGETCEVRFVPQHNENLTRFDIGWNSIDIENESRLVKNDDGSYSFTITYDEINEKTFDILAVFSGGTNDDNAVEYLFIGDFNQVYASADLNDEVQYNGYEFFKQDVSEFYINKVVENEMAANQSATLEFELPNANATGRVFRNGVDLTDQFVNNDGNYYPKEELRSLLHEPAHWVIINESDLMKYDVNRDNKVDISDVTKLVNKVLNR